MCGVILFCNEEKVIGSKSYRDEDKQAEDSGDIIPVVTESINLIADTGGLGGIM